MASPGRRYGGRGGRVRHFGSRYRLPRRHAHAGRAGPATLPAV